MLRKALALPSVKDEVDAVGAILHGKTLLNADFTIDSFRSEAGTGVYQIVHIASHGVFGGTARSSYIMAYDDLLTLDDLQAVLRSEKFQNNPVELLSLSACETAEGDDRSPLGISGAAIKARAKSVLGTLWPVDDRAATDGDGGLLYRSSIRTVQGAGAARGAARGHEDQGFRAALLLGSRSS